MVAGQLPKGFSPETYGIPKDIIQQVDPVTVYALCCICQAMSSAGIRDPLELYKYVHVSELANCLGTGAGSLLAMRGIYRDRYLDHEDFRLLFETAAALKLPVYVHPSWLSPLPGLERWDLDRAIGKPTDLNIDICNLMFSGRVNDLPDLRLLFAHMGGSLPVTLRRLFYGQPGWLRVPDYDYPALLKRLFVDTAPGMWWSPVEIECAAQIIGADRMLMGSDYPLSHAPAEVLKIAVGNVAGADLPDAEKSKIFSGNAIALFGLQHLLINEDRTRHRHAAGGGCC